MRCLSAEETATCLPWNALVDELHRVLQAMRDGRVVAPLRQQLELSRGGVLLTMPAADDDFAVVKLVTVHPHNETLGMPRVQGEVVVMRAESGERLMWLDGQVVTARRTAALSLLAAQALASPQAQRGPLLIVGAGTQAEAHLFAFADAYKDMHIFIFGRNLARAQALAARAAAQGIAAQAVDDLQAVLPECGMVITATNSTSPVLPDAVREDAFIAAIGAFTPSMAELPPSLVRRARLVVDTLDGARHEAGDLIQAEVDWTRVEALAAAVLEPPRSGVTVFKSVGCALWDLAAARAALRCGKVE
ncbi:MAG: delta(1)-pyrroline-2-carboxylate reductase family protein [Anaerolineae bacterium]|nr:delta(1)-pyrroline-2-carboxylate reductase family protein [Thermoflexales bacterium]MCX7938334.1 delta(1)-pyrroline-2-carboxylate reductase family protein [Thermoflexales bacterium]MDW8053026.1 delta(1)-pyrroline-2-carboxylate reductase family protein [Anaerolineae bacterium]